MMLICENVVLLKSVAEARFKPSIFFILDTADMEHPPVVSRKL